MPEIDLTSLACPQPEVFERLLRGLMDDEELSRLEQHLSDCARCCQAVRSLEVDDALVAAVRGAAEIESLPNDDDVRELIGRLKTLRLSLRPLGTGDTIVSIGDQTHGDAWGLENLLDPPQSAGELGRLAGYRVSRVLGAGGMGLVLAAEDPRLARRVAIKVMDRHLAARDEYRQRFLHEARAAAAIEHPHVVAVHQVGEHRGIPFLAMQLLEGESLEERIEREGRLPVHDCLRIGNEIAAALSAAHRRELVHRDIKPANVWLQSPGEVVKLLDFGLARIEGLTRMTHTGLVLGTPAYMSPEQARGDTVGPAGDLFSLGAVLYRISTGREPFYGTNTLAVLTALAIEKPAPPRDRNPEIPPAFSELILRLLAKKPGDRPPSAEVVAAELSVIASRVGGANERPTAARSRKAWPYLVGVGATVVLFAGILAAVAHFASNRGTQAGWPSQAVANGKTHADNVAVTSGPRLDSVPPAADNSAAASIDEEGVAEWILRTGGRVEGFGPGVEQLPRVRYPIHWVSLENTAVDDASLPRLLDGPYLQSLSLRNTPISGAGLRPLCQVYDLHLLVLSNNRQIADVDLEEIARIKSLYTLNLDHTSATIDGLDRLAALPRLMSLSARGIAGAGENRSGEQRLAVQRGGFLCLNELDLAGATVGDGELQVLTAMTGLLSLDLTATQVTDAGIAQLQLALGDCWVVGADGRTHPPPPRPGNPDRLAAERLIEIGYQVTVANPQQKIVSAASELPADDFRLVWVGPGSGTCGDAELRLLAPCRQLTVAHLWGSKAVTPAGVSSLRGLPKLAHLNLSDMPRLSDEVLLMLADLPSLRTVGFHGDYITDAGLRRLPYLPNLEFIDLSGTRISGAALKYLRNDPRLRQLVLTGIALDDADLQALRDLAELEQLDLGGTTIGGRALEHLKPLRHLRRLVLSRNGLTDADTARLIDFQELQQLGLDGTAIGDWGISRLAEKLKNLEWLNLMDTAVSAAGLRKLSELPRLRHLIVGGASWPDADDALAAVGQLRQLEKLELTGAYVTDAAMRSLHQLQQLKSLDLHDTSVTDDGLRELRVALPVCAVSQ